MKRTLKRYTSVKNYIDFLRRQSKHVQHLSAIIFAGAITAIIGAVILYADYGFWHEKYVSKAVVDKEANSALIMPESPSEMLSRFFQEAKNQLKTLNPSGTNFLDGKEVYTKDEVSQ